jgi:hypothetical protein
MQFQHWREHMNEGDVVEVDCSHQCNVHLMDDINFNRYKRGERFKTYGGGYRMLPARIRVPSDGIWNVTLDLGGSPSRYRYGMRILKA